MINLTRQGVIVALLLLATVALALSASGPHDQIPQQPPIPTEQVGAPPDDLVVDQTGPTAISVADVSIKAVEVNRVINAAMHQLFTGRELVTIRQELPGVSTQIAGDFKTTLRVLDNQPYLPVLQGQQQQWQVMQNRLSGWLDTLTERSETIEEILFRLKNLEKSWSTSLIDARISGAPDLLLIKIEETIATISDSLTRLSEPLALVLDLQIRVTEEITRCEGVLAKIADIQQATVSDILIPDSMPVWNMVVWASVNKIQGNLQRALTSYTKDINTDLAKPSRYMFLQAVLFALLILLFLMAHSQVGKWANSGKDVSPFNSIFNFPIVAAFTVSLLVVPNSQLVTEEVTNWTYGDQMKRIDLPVGVSYASSPKTVTELLSKVARQHPQILQQPTPQGLFIGYGDSSINFELRAWTEYIDDWPRIRSDLATAVFEAVHEAGMTFPFPQREVRLLKDSEREKYTF